MNTLLVIQNTLFVNQMTQNTLFYGIIGDGRKHCKIRARRTCSTVSSKWGLLSEIRSPGVYKYNIGQFIVCFLSIHSLCDEDGERVQEQVENR